MMKRIAITVLSGAMFAFTFSIGTEYSSELQQAYNRAYENHITTMSSIEKANMKGNITRAEVAKMISNYAVLIGETAESDEECTFVDVSEDLNDKYDNGIKLSCQFGLMGQGITEFRPNDPVTRAEFGTILSRVLWGDKYEGGTTYYENHLKALKFEGIMNKIDTPMDKEVRGYVMLMLMRSMPESDYVQSYDDEDYTEYDDISYVMEMLD